MYLEPLIYNLLLVYGEKSKINSELITSLISMFRYLPEVEDNMNSIEIIDDNYEMNIFCKVNGIIR